MEKMIVTLVCLTLVTGFVNAAGTVNENLSEEEQLLVTTAC